MLGILTERMQDLVSKLVRQKKLSEGNISDAVNDVKKALLEADVNYGVVKSFVQEVKKRALGQEVLKAVKPADQFIKIVHDELVKIMGEEEPGFNLETKPSVMMLCGLQGSGKTTQCAKVARYFMRKKKMKNPLLVACDLQRPAAVDQLRILGERNKLSVFSLEGEKDPVKVAQASLQYAKEKGHDLLVIDTAGRLHIDEELMQQLESVRNVVNPHEVLLVVNAAMGQDAVNVAKEFNDKIDVTGTVLTMLDGNTRAGAAISIREVTQKPLKFEGVGEKTEDLQLFNAHSMADRILGMGDVINLVRKAEEHLDKDKVKQLEKKIRTATFTYEDYLSQINMVKKMGSFKNLMKMIPGMGALKKFNFEDKQLYRVEAIINSMTPDERQERCEFIISRRERVAKGSGVAVDEVNQLIKSFKQAKKLFKKMPNFKSMQNMFGGRL